MSFNDPPVFRRATGDPRLPTDMLDDLRPATPDEIATTLSFALRCERAERPKGGFVIIPA
jgi:hypothetical protein